VIWGAKKLLLHIFSTSFFVASGGPFFYLSQYHSRFEISTPLPTNDILVIGFMGGRSSSNNTHVGVGRMATALRDRKLENAHIVTVENVHRQLALELVKKAFNTNQDGKLSSTEAQSAKVILYGQSWGGAAVVKFARQLRQIGVPVLLSIQVDSVGIEDADIPSNVRRAGNFYQNNGRIVHGESRIRADDPTRTTILFNQCHDYTNTNIKVRKPWWRTIFRKDHMKMDHDPEVWNQVEELIVEEITYHTR
jgi:hypothetical protein